MKANKVSCKDLREFHESQGNYYEKAFWEKLADALSR